MRVVVVSFGDLVGSKKAVISADVLAVVVWVLTAGIGLLTLARTFFMKLLVFTKGEENGLRRFSNRKVGKFSVVMTRFI